MEEWELAGEEPPDRRERPGDSVLVAILEGPPGRDRTCTLVPREAGEAQLMTQWVTADQGSFVELDEHR